jgi:hypothetical protein
MLTRCISILGVVTYGIKAELHHWGLYGLKGYECFDVLIMKHTTDTYQINFLLHCHPLPFVNIYDTLMHMSKYCFNFHSFKIIAYYEITSNFVSMGNLWSLRYCFISCLNSIWGIQLFMSNHFMVKGFCAFYLISQKASRVFQL